MAVPARLEGSTASLPATGLWARLVCKWFEE